MVGMLDIDGCGEGNNEDCQVGVSDRVEDGDDDGFGFVGCCEGNIDVALVGWADGRKVGGMVVPGFWVGAVP